MNERTVDRYEPVFHAFGEYLKVLKHLVEVMGSLGLQTTNVDPYASFAEVLVARELGGTIQRATNAGFDVIAEDGTKVQVKSLRIDSNKRLANGRGWYEGTRIKGDPTGPLLNAHKYVIVVYLDHSPYCMLMFPVQLRDSFPVLNVKVMNFDHARGLLEGRYRGAEGSVRVIDLRNFNSERIRACEGEIPPNT